jgi:hypothetical protein
MMHSIRELYTRYAAALLLLTVVAGVYLRASFTWPAVGGGMNGAFMVHAHSHTGFFGWAVMAVFAVVAGRLAGGRDVALLHRVLAHAIGIGSFAAFIGFALRGYDVATIVLSALHVLLWVVFAMAAWPRLHGAPAVTARFLRAGLLFLAGSGLATIVPVMLMIRGVSEPWLLQLGVKLFLTPFVTGFLVLSAVGLVYERQATSRFASVVLALIAVGTLPSTLLYVSAAPPLPWLPWVGRGGMALVAAGLLLFVADTLAVRHAPLARLATASAAGVAGIKLLAAAGIGASFMHNRAITVTVLHLVLLGVVTPALLHGLQPRVRAPRRTLAFGAALLLMLVPLAATGWPWAARLLLQAGVPFTMLFTLAAAGAILAALLLVPLVAPVVTDDGAAGGADVAASGTWQAGEHGGGEEHERREAELEAGTHAQAPQRRA